MRAGIVIVLAACGGPGVSTATTALRTAPSERPPDDVADHVHAAPAHAGDPDKLYVEVTSDGDHGSVLRQTTTTALASLPDVVTVAEGGDVELHVELASTAALQDGATCQVKIFVLRLPQHDLLAIADGGARATGATPLDDCMTATGSAIVKDQLPAVFVRQLQAKK